MDKIISRQIHTVIITGTSGSGKSTVLKAFEDMGFFCVDNLPIALLLDFLLLKENVFSETSRVAIVMDIREKDFLNFYQKTFKEIRDMGFYLELLFLDARDDILIRRYNQTRRHHPAMPKGDLVEAISIEKKRLAEIKEAADRVLETSDLNSHQLREAIFRLYSPRTYLDRMVLHIISFGFKYGVPADANLVFDVRFLPNPYFEPLLKELTGKNNKVRDYIFSNTITRDFLNRTEELLDFLIPHYKKEGKSYLVIGIGCTGGHHRSVAIAEYLGELLSAINNDVIITHRDLEKEV